ncbi:MAG: ribulose-phosphate 3-epimerase [Chloroflexi bacterium GWB2_49_20]|nr:MAG: ribulose-phosphate 3-epimerase [Chloroflexi bacterium GWB2_49_20]OGN78044.1 MAG: ribulose-phosphate 3-epimerase [Chloroflexi bacterium GWC2_49_37]OGN85082.1 MAG: ribulose-phosphate 3-epimerase [Chloroflexi bacterium GWD2_49_16]HBG74878.1 ribulose-phosphate 3-epimerase [Anaerolineae bacterium]HCC78397.1 ribulose-phosphate 3-epimerase [Anaerolineae bacterium]
MIVIEPSILSADMTCLGEQVRQVQAAGGTVIQVDVMDGQFVPNLSFGPGVVRALRPLADMQLDVHLMIVQPERFLEQFVQAGADRLIVHQETCPQLGNTLQRIRALGVEAGVSLNPDTPAETLTEVLELADLIQVMTVQPGFGGQAFLSDQLPKIRQLRTMLEQRGLTIPIAVDGGIDIHTTPLAVAAGASVLVAGSSVFNKKGSIEENFAALRASVGR